MVGLSAGTERIRELDAQSSSGYCDDRSCWAFRLLALLSLSADHMDRS